VRREHQHLLDLGQRPFVARRRKLAVQRLERRLLCLRFAETIFQQCDLGLCVAQVVLGIPDDRARCLLGGVDFGKALREFDAQFALPVPCIQPRCRNRRGDQQQGNPRPERESRRRGRGDWGWLRGGSGPVGRRFGHGCEEASADASIVAGRPLASGPGLARIASLH
jgi:hypothetical protein